MNSCTSCRQRKRKCDRSRPSCGSCVQSLRTCTYEEDGPRQQPHPETAPRELSQASALLPAGQVFASPFSRVDPFRHDSLRRPTVEVIVHGELLKVLSSFDNVAAMTRNYFDSIHHRITVISKHRFLDRLPSLSSRRNAEDMALCLCMHLLQEEPTPETESMQSSLYINVKGIMSLLTSSGFQSLPVVQALVLVAFFEIGHAIYPACSLSISMCAKLARRQSIHKEPKEALDSEASRIEHEERKRVWWAIMSLERFINLCDGDAVFGTEDPNLSMTLPVEDSNWARNIVPLTHNATLATPSSVTLGQFARECQVSHLAGRVVRHVFDPTSDRDFQNDEAQQLERTLKAFMPILIAEEMQFSKYCCAIGICSSALFTLYHFASPQSQDAEAELSRKLAAMEPLSNQTAELTLKLYHSAEVIDYDTLSPLATYCMYQSAVVQYKLWKKTGRNEYQENLAGLKRVLSWFRQRWFVAETYLQALEAEWPEMILPTPGFCISG